MQCGTAPPTAKAIGSGSSGGSDAIGGGEENIIDVTAYEEEIEELEEELLSWRRGKLVSHLDRKYPIKLLLYVGEIIKSLFASCFKSFVFALSEGAK